MRPAIQLALVAVTLSFAMPAVAATDPSPAGDSAAATDREGTPWGQIVAACLGIVAGVAIARRQLAARKT